MKTILQVENTIVGVQSFIACKNVAGVDVVEDVSRILEFQVFTGASHLLLNVPTTEGI